MYTQKNKAGIKEFFLAVAGLLILSVVLDIFKYAVANEALRDVLQLAAACAYGCFVYLHYTASFEYSVNEERISIVRKIGFREKNITISTAEAASVKEGRAALVFDKNAVNMSIHILPSRKSVCIYRNDGSCVIIDADDKMKKILKEYFNG